MLHDQFALITGSSSGIGKYLAAECAAAGYQIVLVALPETGIHHIARNLRYRFNCIVHVVECDLSSASGPETVFRYCIQKNLQVSVLINNAGIGCEDAFGNLHLSRCNDLLQLNMVAVVKMTKLFLPVLQAATHAYIMNVSSLASFTPVPFKGIYAASKAFIRSFSLSLRHELKHTNVSVCTLCPGAVPTNDYQRAIIRRHGLAARLSSIEPHELARIAVEKMLQGNAIVIPGLLNRISRMLMMITPGWLSLELIYMNYKSKLIS